MTDFEFGVIVGALSVIVIAIVAAIAWQLSYAVTTLVMERRR